MSSLSETQELFQTSVSRLLAGMADRSEDGSVARWNALAELGAVLAAVPEDRGGLGGPREMVIVAQQLGYAGALMPYLARGVLPAVFAAGLSQSGLDVESIGMGETLVTAMPSFPPGYPEDGLSITLGDDGGTLSGRVSHIMGLADASTLLIAARVDGSSDTVILMLDAALFAGATSAPGIDGDTRHYLTFDKVPIGASAILSAPALPAFLYASDAAMVGQCAEMVGNMSKMFELTLAYIQVRRQFGQALSEFQALRHRIADMFAELDQAKAMLNVGVDALEQGSAQTRARMVSACKVRISQAARYVGAQSIQLHGAIALTEEYELGAFYQRSLVLRKLWGDDTAHAERMVALREPQAAADLD